MSGYWATYCIVLQTVLENVSALKILTRTIKIVIFAFRCWSAFKTNRCSAADSLRASKNNEEQAHLIDQVFWGGILIWQFSFRARHHWERISLNLRFNCYTEFQSLSVKLVSLSCIPDSTSIFSRIPNSTDQNFLDSKIRLPLQKDCSPSASGSAAPLFLSLTFTQPKSVSFLFLQLFL